MLENQRDPDALALNRAGSKGRRGSFWAWLDERQKTEVHTSEMKNSSQEKKPYQPGSCTQLPLTEFARLVRTKMVGREIRPGRFDLSALANLSILLVEDYAGDLTFVRPAVRAAPRELQSFPIQRKVGWFEMQLADAEGAEPQAAFLLLDLRHRHQEQRRFFESVDLPQKFNVAVPRVILATSSEPSLDWAGVDRAQCWLLRDCTSMEDLAATLRSFLRLCAMFTDCTAGYVPHSGNARS